MLPLAKRHRKYHVSCQSILEYNLNPVPMLIILCDVDFITGCSYIPECSDMFSNKRKLTSEERLYLLPNVKLQYHFRGLQFVVLANDCKAKPTRCPFKYRYLCICPGGGRREIFCDNGVWKPLPCGNYNIV